MLSLRPDRISPESSKVLEEVDWEKLGAEGVKDEAGPSLAAKSEPSRPARTQPPPPASMALFHRGSHIEIVRKWFGGDIVVATGSAVMLGLVAFWIYPKQGTIRISEESLMFLSAVAAAVYLTYCAIAGCLNRTHIVVSRDKITVRHEPVPWPGNKELAVSNVKKVCIKEQIHQTRSRVGLVTRATYTYDVHVLTLDGQIVKLVGGLKEQVQAFFITQQIDEYLGIKDAPVKRESRAALGKDVAIDAGVAAAYTPRLDRTGSAREIRDALLTHALTQQEKRHESWHKQDLSDLALNWHERGRPDSLQHADLTQADLRGARLGTDEEGHPGANLSFANLLNAKLGGADLREVDLYNANLSGAALEGANLEGANLYEVNFSGANLEGANLVGAKVIPEQLAQARSLKGAIMPDGTVYE